MVGSLCPGNQGRYNTNDIQLLLDAGADVNATDDDGETALIAAARGGHTEAAQILLDAGADVNATDIQEQTALITAAQWGHTETVQALLVAGAEVEKEPGEYSLSALMTAAFEGHIEVEPLCANVGETPA